MIPFVDVIRSLYVTIIRYIISALACVKTWNILESDAFIKSYIQSQAGKSNISAWVCLCPQNYSSVD